MSTNLKNPQNETSTMPTWIAVVAMCAILIVAIIGAFSFWDQEKQNEDLRNMVNILEASRQEACKGQISRGACNLIPEPTELNPMATVGKGTTKNMLKRACKSWAAAYPLSPMFCVHFPFE